MITPKFSVRQDDDRIYIDIRIINIRTDSKSIEFRVEGDLFVFALSPYYLRLRFPGQLLSDEDEKVIDDEKLKSTIHYNTDKSVIEISISKALKGTYFEDLDLATKLLARTVNIAGSNNTEDINDETQRKRIEEQIKSASTPVIQEIDYKGNELTTEDIDNHFSKLSTEAETHNWEIEQTDPGRAYESSVQHFESGHSVGKYGFNSQYSEIIGVSIADGSNDVNDVIDPETSTPESRHQSRFELEALSFDSDYYLSDAFDEPPELDSILKWESPVNISFNNLSLVSKDTALESEETITFSTKETDYMLRIAKEKGISGVSGESAYNNISHPKKIYIGLVCIIFSVCYDERTTMGDPTVESAWTISKLCPLFSALDEKFDTLSSAVIACIRRALCFPLIRNWKLIATTVFQKDVYQVLRLGKRRILRILLKLKEILESSGGSGNYFVYSKIWVDDYIAWIQLNASDSVIRALAHELRKLKWDPQQSLEGNDIKSLVGLELNELEEAAKEIIQERDNDIS